MKNLGVVLLLGSAGAIVGLILWLVFKEPSHLAIRIIVPIVVAGFLIILAAVTRDRLMAIKKERFEEKE